MARVKLYNSAAEKKAAYRARHSVSKVDNLSSIVDKVIKSKAYDNLASSNVLPINNKNNHLTTNSLETDLTCSASTTASNSTGVDYSTQNHPLNVLFDDVICDWLSFRHEYPINVQMPVLASGKILKIDRDGVIENEIQQWENIRCPSSDTSIRIKCDGNRLWFQGNIGRFQEQDNQLGLTVIECFEKAQKIINNVFPLLDTRFLGAIISGDTVAECGTYLTRLDLASNFETSDFAALNRSLGSSRIGQKLPREGRFGQTWGYDTKRGQYWKAKIYDKKAELLGMRTPHQLATLARFEVQLGSEYLRQNKLNRLMNWTGDIMKIIYNKFASQAFKQQSTVETWSELPSHLRQHAVLWRDGVSPKSYMSKSGFYKVRSQLLEHGIDISIPCNVMNLVQRVKVIEVRPVATLRKTA